MSRKLKTYEDLLVEKQKLEVLFEAQKALVKFEIDDIVAEIELAFNVMEFLKKLSLRNKENPIMQTGINLLIDALSNKTKGENAGFLRTAVLPYIIKNYAGNLLSGPADEIMHQIVSLFVHTEEDEEN